MKTLTEIKQFADTVEAFLNSSPSTEDIEGCDAYLQAMKGYSATLSNALGRVKAMHQQNVVTYVRNADETEYKRVKNSSTLVDAMAVSIDGGANTAYLLTRLDGLKRSMQDASTQLCTMIAYRREELYMTKSRVSNTKPERMGAG